MYVLKLAFRPWRLAPASQLVHSMSVGFLLLAFALLMWFEQSLKPVISRLEHEQIVTAYLAPAVAPGQEKQVEDAIRVQLGAHSVSGVQVTTTTREEFLQTLKDKQPDLAAELVGVGAETEEGRDLVPRFITLQGWISPEALDSVKKVTGVESLESSESRTRPIASVFKSVRFLIRFLALGLVMALITGLYQLGKMHSTMHGHTALILRQWGAGAWTAKLPGLFSGLSIGLLGGALAAFAWVWGSRAVYAQLIRLTPALHSLPAMPAADAILPLVMGAALGAWCGFWTQKAKA